MLMRKHNYEMSESFLTMAFLAFSGGLQDAYTYLARGHVFANAQTGNIVLLSQNIFDGHWLLVIHYLVPVLFFSLGIAAAQFTRERSPMRGGLHWRQNVVLGEILILFVVGFLPSTLDLIANAIVSFSCALQVQAFRKVNGYPFASTMCIGNLRSGVESLYHYGNTKNCDELEKALLYFGIIILFALGAGVGAMLTRLWHLRAIWASCALLVVSFSLMFLEEKEEEEEQEQAA